MFAYNLVLLLIIIFNLVLTYGIVLKDTVSFEEVKVAFGLWFLTGLLTLAGAVLLN